MNNKLEIKLKNLPFNPGVYLYKDKTGKIIYIGKAKNLCNRILSYFQNQGKHEQFKTEVLVRRISDLDYIITDTELEAVFLERNLIKKHKPKYNIDLKDDKSYPYIRITKELYPRIIVTRTIVKDGSTYLGPYTNVKYIRQILKNLKKIFLIRNCSLNITEESVINKKHKVCLDYHIKICEGVCVGHEASDTYNRKVRQIISFFNGNESGLTKILEDKMLKSSENLEFEKAAKYRDQLNVVKGFSEKQKVESPDMAARDFIHYAREENDVCCVVFKIRNGKLISRNQYFLKHANEKDETEILQEFIKLYYPDIFDYPQEVILPAELEDSEVLSDWLSSLKNKKVSITVPKIGTKNKLLWLAEKNAKILLNDHILSKIKKDFTPRSISSLHRDLNLKKIPNLIECFDISHFAGRETVASMVCFKNGSPYKKRYRRFKIQTVEGVDDFASMREVVYRRYKRLSKEKSEEEPLPDLIIIDGGKGQLSSAYRILKELKLNIEVIGLAKKMEEVFFPGESDSIMVPRTSSGLKLIQQLRDEAHRFAITYHRNLRQKEQTNSRLNDVEGIGKAKSSYLLKKFGSLKNILKASDKEILAVNGISRSILDKIRQIKE